MLTLIAQFGSGITPPGDRFSVVAGKDSAVGENALGNLEFLISQMIGFLTIIATLFFITYFVMGAFKWTAAGGDAGKVSKARDQMIQGVLGLILVVAAYGIVGLIGTVLGLDILNPAAQIKLLL